MKDPKSFSRKLDTLLTKIGKDATHENFISSILNELVDNFGKELQITDGCIYDQRDKNFIRVYAIRDDQWQLRISMESRSIQLLSEHGSYIFDDPELRQEFVRDETTYRVPAAVTINTPERLLLVVFGLEEGWIREEISLFINAFQMALSFRLFSDIMDTELEKAVQIQKSLLPRSAPNIPGFDVYGRSIPTIIVGGDFYEYFESDEGYLGLSIGDASGHGIPAALLVRDVVVGLRMGLASNFKLAYIIKKLNKVIQKNSFASNFVSLVLGEFEKDGHFFYVNAGHPSPFIIKDDQITELKSTGMVMGFLKDLEVQRSHVQMEKNSVMVMYTDGIIERTNDEGEQYEIHRLHKLIMENQDKSAKDIVNLIYKDVYRFGGSVHWEDDATVVVIKRV
ncbi:MAG: PP2C family protein-serine/threonine phosphatase [Fidelibacterota bacterium]